MNDLVEVLKVIARGKQLKRERNAAEAPIILTALGVSYKVVNSQRMRIQSVKKQYDFWPATGDWSSRGHEVQHRGIVALLSRLKSDGAILNTTAPGGMAADD